METQVINLGTDPKNLLTSLTPLPKANDALLVQVAGNLTVFWAERTGKPPKLFAGHPMSKWHNSKQSFTVGTTPIWFWSEINGARIAVSAES